MPTIQTSAALLPVFWEVGSQQDPLIPNQGVKGLTIGLRHFANGMPTIKTSAALPPAFQEADSCTKGGIRAVDPPSHARVTAPMQASVSMDPVLVNLDRCIASSPFRRWRDMDQDFPARAIASGADPRVGKEPTVVERTYALVV
ncbi:Pol polyprotein [Plakobranchus ocellatus]|uniref:Pol polyprotein n=1 Tax=Plakobranchus ocellatus TaxID=259542 RepID=A0AAV4BFD7_9GAST|nr:Pol polyprotein [Plakobranchus ocellatus]